MQMQTQMLTLAFLVVAIILILVLFIMNDKQSKGKAILVGLAVSALIVFIHFLLQVHIDITTDGPVLALAISTVVAVILVFIAARSFFVKKK